jgi:hypothetical protein
MIPLLIFGGWALIVAFACTVGMAREDWAAVLLETKRLKSEISAARNEARLAQEKTAMLLEYTDREIAEEYTEFDEVLRGLPVVDHHQVGYSRQHHVMRARGFHAAAYNAVTEDIANELTVTKLSFDAKHLYLANRPCVAWCRNGWLILHEK